MEILTPKEAEALLLIYKDFSTSYNAHSIAPKLGITPRGALKLLKNLQKQHLLIGKRMGKATFYKPNVEDAYAKKLIEVLLIKEASIRAKQWLAECEGVFKHVRIAIVFGSALKKPAHARDVDLMLIIDKERLKAVNNFVEEKNRVLLQPIHPIILTLPELLRNLQEKNPAAVLALKEGSVLHGGEQLIEVMKHVISF